MSRLRPNGVLYLASCVVLVAMCRLGLTLVSYTTLRRLVPGRRSRKPTSLHANPALLRRVGWAVAKSARVVPYATCLTKALAVEFLLACHHQQAEVHIGVTKGEDGQLRAHAWVTSCGRLVIGGPLVALERYTRLTGAGLSSS